MSKILTAFLICIPWYFYNLNVLQFAEGDQVAYERFYEGVGLYGPGGDYTFYRNSLDASEPMYFFLVKVCKPFLSKVEFSALLSAFFNFALVYLILKKKLSIYWYLLICFGFYNVVLMFGAERLKLAFSFFFLALATTGSRSFLYQVLAILSHMTFAPVAALLLAYRMNLFRKSRLPSSVTGKKNQARVGLFACAAGAVAVVAYVMVPAIRSKLNYYLQVTLSMDFLLGVGVLLCVFPIVRRQRDYLVFSGVVLFFLFLLGGDRINMFLIFGTLLFLFDSFKSAKEKANIVAASGLIHGLLIYLGLKSIGFMQRLYETGDGF